MTDPTLAVGLNAIAKEYEGKDLVTLLFPANDFFNQEAYDISKPEEFLNELKYVRPGGGYVPPATQIFQKIHVNGETEHEVYSFLKTSCPNTWGEQFPTYALNYQPQYAKDIWWNYEKFLVARNGSVYTRYSPAAFTLEALKPDIDTLLAQEA